jgi:hypothetical protein
MPGRINWEMNVVVSMVMYVRLGKASTVKPEHDI